MNRLFGRSGKPLILILAAIAACILLPSSAAWADSVSACILPTPTFPCSIGGSIIISGFSFFSSGGGSGAVTATLINDPLNPGFTITGNKTDTGPETKSSTIQFDISTVSGLATIKDVSVCITGSLTNTSGTATASLTVSTPNGPPLVLNFTSASGTFCGQITFSPVSSFSETITLLDSLGTGDTGTATSLQYQASLVPEPGSLILLGTGLAGLAVVIRRRARRT